MVLLLGLKACMIYFTCTLLIGFLWPNIVNTHPCYISCVHTAGCKSTYHRWQVPPGGAPVVSGGENAAGCNLPPTKLDLPLINNGGNGIYYRWQLYNRCVWTAVGGKALLCFVAVISFCTVLPRSSKNAFASRLA